MRREKRNQKENKRIVVAMSGGLDSSVAAALLKRDGFYHEGIRLSSAEVLGRRVDVIGVFMKFWEAPEKDGLMGGWNRCCSPEAEIRARKVAKILKIPFYVFNFEKEFRKRIVDYFLDGYKKGITPNPCVVCNKEIKFGLLLEKSLSLGADFVATGHYARTTNLNFSTPVEKFKFGRKEKNDKIKLLRARDKEKDQSYFLWQLNQNQLKMILFPIGDYTRKEVEKLAKKFKLPVLKARKSVEICFVKTTINDFLKKYLKEKPGKIICLTPGVKQKVIGEHRGLYFYTIGQRKGIGLPGGPYFVLDKDQKRNLLIVTKNEKDLYEKELIAKNVNWISPKQSLRDATGQTGKAPKLPLKVKAKIRYRTQLTPTTIAKKLKAKSYKLIFDKPQRAITPGQSVVFYKGDEVLGGGIIC